MEHKAQTVLLSCTLAWCRLKRRKRSTEPTVIQQPPSLISTLQGNALKGAGKEAGEKALLARKEAAQDCRFSSADVMRA